MTIYSSRIVAFIDILGFSNLVHESEMDTDKANLLLGVLKDIESFIDKENRLVKFSEEFNTKNIKIDYTQFSDSIVLSTEIVFPMIYDIEVPNYNNLMYICSLISFLQAKYMNDGILMRGGVTWGSIYHENNICFGPAFIRAYQIESKMAKYPRVVIDPELIDLNLIPTPYKNNDHYPYMINSLKEYLFVLDNVDNNYFINFMLLNTFKQNVDPIVEILNQKLSNLITTNEDDKKVIDKLNWLRDKISVFKKW